MKRSRLAVALVVAGFGASSLSAQQTPPPAAHAHPQPQAPTAAGASAAMGGMNMEGSAQATGMMGRMGAMMAPQGASEILAMRQALALSDAQVQQLQAIAAQAREAAAPHMAAAMQAHHAAMQALEAEQPDLARYQAELQATATHFVEGQVALARSAIRALEVLTPEQRSNVRFAIRLEHARMMQGMMGGMGGTDMPGMTMPGKAPAGAMPMPHDSTKH